LIEELQVVKDEILEAVNSKTVRMEEQLEAIYSRIMSTSDSTFRAFFISFILPIIIGLLTSIIYDYRIKPFLAAIENSNKQVAIKKEVTRNVKLYLTDPQQRVHYRIVTTNVLAVRNGKSKSSRKIGYTFFGDVVEVVRKERNWCLIRRYNRENETFIQGWVFTRYLERIR
ncbi:SH3 domain-containing protein, partial [Sulfuricurvum sp.]|uniref:SH3 domain-containing protein n=1 Tax=Sulfuricurvum sp. TaxID=2025608 RepID=UPI0026045FE9